MPIVLSAHPVPQEPEPGRRWWRDRRRLLLVGCVTLAAAAVVVPTTVQALRQGSAPEPVPESEPERVVREFLAAVAERDPQRALAVAGATGPPGGEHTQFLDPAAMSDQWEVREVAVENPGLVSSPEWVEVAIAGPDGATVRSTVRTELDEDEQWVIPEPFATVTFLPSPLWYVDVNGVRAPAGRDVQDVEYLLLPGFYDLYPRLPLGVQAEFEDQLLLPGAEVVVTAQGVVLTEPGERAIQQAVEDYLDACAQSAERTPHACPFGVEIYSRLPGLSVGWSFDDEVEWTIRDYPVVAAAPSDYAFLIADRQRGVVELRATVDWVERRQPQLPYAPPGEGSVAAVECETDLSQLEAGFTATGDVEITFWLRQYAYPDQYPPDKAGETQGTETCHHAAMADT